LPALAVTADHAVLTPKGGWPKIDTMEIALLHRPTVDPVIKELARDLAQMLEREHKRGRE